MGIKNIETDRLIIIPITYSIMRSILNGDNTELDKLGVKTNGRWPLQDTLDILNFLKDSIPKNNVVSGFDVWMLVKKEGMCVIGDAGFKGQPDENGRVEVGFGLIEEEQRKGFGYEAASALIEWASHQANVKTIAAGCLIGNIGSIRVLKKCGMSETSRDNDFIYWEKKIV
ncbi:MAG: GNAT family N-acetyltransferase [Thermoclostridium sp.]|nr:GNAT family N-acetyltransferase [Thermoclostridium sp.]